MEQVGGVDRLAADLGIEVEAARRKAARAQDFEHRERHFLDRVGELIGIPAVLRIAAVGVDRAKDAERARRRDLMFEGVAREGRVVRLDIDADLVLQPIALEEAVHRCRVEVVLVLGRFVRLGFDQDRAGEADLMLVIDDEAEEAAEIVEFALHVGVVERLIALATAPQHVVGAAEAVRRFEGVAHLHRAPGEHLRIRVGGATGGIARVAEQIGGAPQELAAGGGLKLFEVIDGVREMCAVFGYRRGIGHHVDVVEAIIGHIELAEEVEGDRAFVFRCGGIVGAAVPGAIEGAAAEDVAARPAEGVPEAGSEAEMLLHRLAEDDTGLVVIAIGEFGVALRPFVTDRRNVGEVFGHFRGS
ncbi:hypothetical protein BJP26_13020 [Sphingomonas melonis TY]|nr:hypothetical protein BJP26_13020 [Sphingomonas melonis TY]